MAKKIIDQLVDYILAAPDASLPSEVVQKAKNHLLDTLAAIVSGSQLTPGRLGLEYAAQRAANRKLWWWVPIC